MADLPQLWEFEARLELAEREEAAEELRTAVLVRQASVTLAERLRGATGGDADLRFVDGTALRAAIEIATDSGVLLADGVSAWYVPLRAVAAVGLDRVPPALPARGSERRPERAVLREPIGRAVRVRLRGGFDCGGRLDEVGADHLLLDSAEGPMMIGMDALVWVRWSADGAISPAGQDPPEPPART